MSGTLYHRSLLFSFLGDPSLSKDQRAIGVVLILKTSKKMNFRTTDRPVDWDKIGLLTGYGERTIRRVFRELIKAEWLELCEGKQHAYRVVRTRIAIAQAKLAEHMAAVSAAERDRAPLPVAADTLAKAEAA